MSDILSRVDGIVCDEYHRGRVVHVLELACSDSWEFDATRFYLAVTH